jgi:aminoglycoside phosphotransferase (APT) family kinase protein
LVAAAPEPASIPSLYPPPPWAGWDDALARPWPAPDEGAELNKHPSIEPLRGLAVALNEQLRDVQLARRVGHVDFYQGNLRWQGNDLLALHDWDSLAVLPEAAIVGCAAASFRPGIPGVHPDTWPGAEVDDTEEFLQRYQQAAGREFTSDEVAVAWAAGLWQRVFDAAKALVAGRPADAADQLRDVDTRTRLAGITPTAG